MPSRRRCTPAFAMSNFYEAALGVYLEMAAFGTAANIMVGNSETLSVNHPLTFGEYGIGDRRGRPLQRAQPRFTLTTKQMVEKFVADSFDSSKLDWSRVTQAVKEAWDGGHYGRTSLVHQLIEQNPAYVPGKIGTIGMQWRSIKWQPEQIRQDQVPRDRGLPRSAVHGAALGNAVGRGLGHRARQEGAARHAGAAACGQAVGRSRGHGGQAADLWPAVDRPRVDAAGLAHGVAAST
jgi:hypothetical protein